jgi:nucleoside-diphosphate-sugar epimerase
LDGTPADTAAVKPLLEKYMKGTALIIGMTGGIGGATARALAARGFRIRAMHRNAAAQRQRNVEWVQGDAMSAADVMAAAAGAAVIVHAVNPPKYHDWRGLALPMLANTIAAARKTGATIVFPGTLYNYGPDAGELVNEQSPQNPVTRKGRIRAEMEWMLLDASRAGARVIIVRAGDFFGPGAGGNWFSQALVRPGKAVSRVFYPGRHAVGHSWAYLPDLADAIAGLVQRRGGFGAFETFHFEGHWLPRGVEMAEAICTVADLPFRRIRAAALVGDAGACHPSSRVSGRRWRCATCGSNRWRSTTASWWRRWEANRTRPARRRPRHPRGTGLPRGWRRRYAAAIICRSMNFWTLPVTVIGKVSRKRT